LKILKHYKKSNNKRTIGTKIIADRNICDWSYYTNPLNEDSSKIYRISNIESFANDALDIVINKRFDQDYITESINEGIINISVEVVNPCNNKTTSLVFDFVNL